MKAAVQNDYLDTYYLASAQPPPPTAALRGAITSDVCVVGGGLALLRQRIERYQINCDWVDGWMLAAIKPRQWSEIQAWQADLVQRYGYTSTRLMDRAGLQATGARTGD